MNCEPARLSVLSPGEIIERAIISRRSIRRFLKKPVEQQRIEHILDVAARAPSGTNMQPWRVHVIAGDAKKRLSDALVAAHLTEKSKTLSAEYKYYPDKFFEPYISRRRKIGWDLYSLLGIKKRETERMRHQHAANFMFFDAPVGMIFTIDRRLENGSWLDYGMFLENIMIAARAHDLDTCCQAAFAPLHEIIREHLPLEPEEIVICGMSIGYADHSAVVNRLETDRTPAREFARFTGFGQN